MKKALGEKLPPYRNETGKLLYGLTNDYMFRALLQENNSVLKQLICSLKHLKQEKVKSVVIQNPILLGAAIDNKTYILDVKVEMNDGSIINFEMQTYSMAGWKERSLLYLCRAFDKLHQGEQYHLAKDVTHIGFLDYTLFPETPEFYATYKMMNLKNHTIYTDKFILSVVDLTCINLATEEDKEWHIDTLASLFKATTWEEIKMLAEKDEVIREAADTIYRLSQDSLIREQCRAREDYKRQMDYYERKMKELAGKDAALANMENVLADKEAELLEKDKVLSERNEILLQKEAEIERLKKMLGDRD